MAGLTDRKPQNMTSLSPKDGDIKKQIQIYVNSIKIKEIKNGIYLYDFMW